MGVAVVKTPAVDILLAAYNGEKYLPEQLASLRKQFRQDFRVLMHDDGSTDGTPELLSQVCREDSRFVMAENRETGLGAAGSFIALMKESSAPCCCLCDQDDVWTPDHVLVLLRDLEKLREQVGFDAPMLVTGDCAVTDETGRLLHPSFCMHQGWKREALPLRMLLVQNNATGCTMLLNGELRRLVTEHARPERMFMHDWFIAQTAAAFGAIWFEQLPLVDYRQHGSNALGASADGLLTRGAKALSHGEGARQRIALTYRQTELLLEVYGDSLSAPARRELEGYLATEHMPKLKRVLTVRRRGYVMQNSIARLGQLIFG